jgi:hypothetical protein
VDEHSVLGLIWRIHPSLRQRALIQGIIAGIT